MKGVAQLRPTHRSARIRGASAVEFALIFPIMFAIAYAGIVYGYVYMLQQSINFAAQQGAEAALIVVPMTDTSQTQSARASYATSAAKATLNWLPSSQLSRLSFPSTASNCKNSSFIPGSFAFEVDFTPTGLFPMTTLPLVGTFPPVPATMIACAVL